MPRMKPETKIDTLERKKRDLLKELRQAKAKANAKRREAEDRKALIMGRVLLAECQANPSGQLAAAVLATLNAKIARRPDRLALGLSVAPAKARKAKAALPPPQTPASAPEPAQNGLFGKLARAAKVMQPRQRQT